MHRQLLLFPPICIALVCVAMAGQNCPPETQEIKPATVFVRDIDFWNASLLSQDEEQKISSTLRREELSKRSQSPDQLAALAEEGAERVRAAYQNNGYFKVEVSDQILPLDDPGHFDIVIRVLKSGQQYRMGDIHFVRALQFSEPELRDAFPIQRGDIFSREKIAQGIEALRAMYDSRGYINFTPVPETEFDEADATADLTIDIDEGRQFRFRSIDVLGADPQTRATLLAVVSVKPGDVYNSEALKTMFRKFPSLFPNPNSQVIGKTLDEAAGQVDVLLDLRKKAECSYAAANAVSPQNQ